MLYTYIQSFSITHSNCCTRASHILNFVGIVRRQTFQLNYLNLLYMYVLLSSFVLP